MNVSQDTRVWFHGLAAAFVGAAATSLSTSFAAPTSFNFTSRIGLQHLAIVCLVSGIGAAAAYLMRSPLPPNKLTAVDKTSVQSPDGTTTTTTSAVKIQ